MDYKHKKAKFGLTKLICVLLAVVLCFTLTLQVFAADSPDAENSDTDKVITDRITDEESTEDGQESEADQSAEEIVLLTPEMMSAAWDALLAELDVTQNETYSGVITAVRMDARFLRQDIYDAVVACTEAVRDEKALFTMADTVTSRIAACENLPEEQKTLFLQQIDQQLSNVGMAPMDLLMLDLQELQVDETLQLSAVRMAQFSEAANALAEQLENLEKLLGKLVLMPGLEMELAKLTEQFAGVTRADGSGEAALAQKIADCVSRCDAIAENIRNYFALSEEAQVQLPKDIQQLSDEMQVFASSAVIDAVKQGDSLEESLKAVAQQAERVHTLTLMLYVALGIAVLSVILGIVAAIMAAAKARDKDIDLSGFAGREDVEALNRQNAALKQQLDQQEQKLDQTSQALDRAVRELNRLEEECRTLKVQPVIPVVTEVKPENQNETRQFLGSDKQVGMLKMFYQSVNAANSYLVPDDHGTYVLFSDSTVELTPRQMRMSNDANGWIESGVFHLFNPEFDGKMLDPERDMLPKGYCSVAEIKRRAVVRQTGNGSYVLQQKGILRMKQ